MFDLTKNIQLPPDWQKKYRVIQFFVFLLFAAGVFYFSHLVLFPSKTFDFFFRTPSAAKNTIVNPRYPEGKLVFDSAISPAEGNFSDIKVSFILEKDSQPVENGSVILARKSYQAFFYPEGDPVTVKYEKTPNLPFPDGSLVASKTSVFITSRNTIYPIDEQATFQSMGFDWGDVIAATSEEVGAYQKGKLFTIASPHPNGTVFSEKESGKYYLVENGKKRELKGAEMISSYLNKNPVIADERSLELKNQCFLKKDFSLMNTSYSCRIPVENLAGLLGNDYQYETSLRPDVKIKEAHIVFKKRASWEDFKLALSGIKKNIIANFYGQPQQ